MDIFFSGMRPGTVEVPADVEQSLRGDLKEVQDDDVGDRIM
jgi:hypothetical protein